MLFHNFVGKFHLMWHIVDLARWMIPLMLWCYSFETYIGHVVRAARACTTGTPMTGISRKVASNAALALHLACVAFAGQGRMRQLQTSDGGPQS